MNTQYKVCFLAAGKGTRNTFYKGLHKGLWPYENKAVISHLIDLVPRDVSIVMAIGHLKNQVKSYVEFVHNDRDITFVEVDKIEGHGSGPGYSLLLCKEYLQCPFIWAPIDSIFLDQQTFRYNEYIKDWFSCVAEDRYGKFDRYIKLKDDLMQEYYKFSGVACITNYQEFFNKLEYKEALLDELHPTDGLPNWMEAIDFRFIDLGTDASYLEEISKSKQLTPLKSDGTIYFANNKVIKWFRDKEKLEALLSRKIPLSPTLHKLNDNMIWYNYVNGTLLSNIRDRNIFVDFIQQYWLMYYTAFVSGKSKQMNTGDIELKKIQTRLNSFSLNLEHITKINGLDIPKIDVLLNSIPIEMINTYSCPTYFHGDLQPENIIVKEDGTFCLIDARPEGFDEGKGDLLYDFAKLKHALIVSNENVLKNLYEVNITNNSAELLFQRKSNLVEFEEELNIFINNFPYTAIIDILTSLQFIGIAPLYQDENYSKFLYLLGKYELTKTLEKYGFPIINRTI